MERRFPSCRPCDRDRRVDRLLPRLLRDARRRSSPGARDRLRLSGRARRPTATVGQRGEPSAHLPPTAFVNFLQNHDQIGNRAYSRAAGRAGRAGDRRRADRDPAAQPAASRCSSWARSGARRGRSTSSPISTASSATLVREGRRAGIRQVAAFRRPGAQRADRRPERRGDIRGFRAATGSAAPASRNVRGSPSCKRLLDVRQREIVPLDPGDRRRCRAARVSLASEGLLGDVAVAGGRRALALRQSRRQRRSSAMPPVPETAASSSRMARVPSAHFVDGSLMPLAVISLVEDGADFVPLPG